MSRDRFIDPATGSSYAWPRNHLVEEQGTRARKVTSLWPTAAGWQQVHPVRVGGADSPLVKRLSGTLADEHQHEAFLRFFRLCDSQTVHYQSCHGGRFEVLITDYTPTRRRVVRARGGANLIRTYTIDMEVVTQLA